MCVLQEPPKLVRRKATLLRDISHRVSIHWICARDLNRAQAIAHSNVLALPDYNESNFLQCSDCCQTINAGQLRHACRDVAIGSSNL